MNNVDPLMGGEETLITEAAEKTEVFNDFFFLPQHSQAKHCSDNDMIWGREDQLTLRRDWTS